MAGAFLKGGNITPTAEFNAYVDPEAAMRVLESGVTITLLPLDVARLSMHPACLSLLSTRACFRVGRSVSSLTSVTNGFYPGYRVARR